MLVLHVVFGVFFVCFVCLFVFFCCVFFVLFIFIAIIIEVGLGLALGASSSVIELSSANFPKSDAFVDCLTNKGAFTSKTGRLVPVAGLVFFCFLFVLVVRVFVLRLLVLRRAGLSRRLATGGPAGQAGLLNKESPRK